MAFEDKTLQCKDCGSDFIFSSGEQEFYAEKGFENEPVRCRDCRDARKRNRDGGEGLRSVWLDRAARSPSNLLFIMRMRVSTL